MAEVVLKNWTGSFLLWSLQGRLSPWIANCDSVAYVSSFPRSIWVDKIARFHLIYPSICPAMWDHLRSFWSQSTITAGGFTASERSPNRKVFDSNCFRQLCESVTFARCGEIISCWEIFRWKNRCLLQFGGVKRVKYLCLCEMEPLSPYRQHAWIACGIHVAVPRRNQDWSECELLPVVLVRGHFPFRQQ